MVDALVLFVQADRLHHQVVDTQRDQGAVQAVTERAGFIATMHLLGQRQLGLDPFQELGRGELLGRLRRAIIQNAHDDDGVGVNVQAQFERLQLRVRDLIRANFGGIKFLFEHTVGWCSASAPASQLLMSSPYSGSCVHSIDNFPNLLRILLRRSGSFLCRPSLLPGRV